MVRLLEVLEAAGWPEEYVANPLSGYDEATKAKRLRQAVRNVNSDLDGIRLEDERGGRRLRWRRT